MMTANTHLTKVQVSALFFRPLALSVIVALFAIVFFAPVSAEAAQIVFNPNDIHVTLKPGDYKRIPYTLKLANTNSPSPYVFFTAAQTDGNIDPAWLSSNFTLYLWRADMFYSAYFLVKVPLDAKPGKYRGVLSPTKITSNENITASALKITVDIEGEVTCDQPPEFAEVTTLQNTVQSKDKEPLIYKFTGTIISPEQCSITKAWYQLTDEYGLLDETKPVTVGIDGKFNVTIPVVATRKGTDKDGRMYTIIFGAENEAGTTMGGGKQIIISHDNRDNNPSEEKKAARH